ncbi:hypothetical protein [Paraburkholderia sp. J11-2]|uniref:hypothetical protein n=1 Tax=Paraburkholderia sp. J11-2 TaxID=2805431 RepID=UPI002AB6A0A8|nr:hypothetical protein [Paraburkholderia sp. J11-2]
MAARMDNSKKSGRHYSTRLFRGALAITVLCLLLASCKKAPDRVAASASDAAAASAPAAAAADVAPPADRTTSTEEASKAPPAAAADVQGEREQLAQVSKCETEVSSNSFPNPVPQPSAESQPLDVKFATPAHGRALTFGDIELALNKLLRKANYGSQQYYPFPCGFALVTRVEQTDSLWTPLKPPARWAVKVNYGEAWSMESVIKQFARAPKGYYQILVFLVTDMPVIGSGNYPELSFFDKSLKGGANKLSTSLENRKASEHVKCTVLIYEFWKADGVDAQALEPGQLDAMGHLQRASLISGLEVVQ